MADFCYDCVQQLGIPADRNDLRHTEANPIRDLCETCGFGEFDQEGKRVTPRESGEPMTEKERVLSILAALKLPEGQYMLGGSGVMVLHDIQRTRELEEIEIFVSTALWFHLYEDTALTWGLGLPDPEDPREQNHPPYLFTNFAGIQVNIFHSWRYHSIGLMGLAFGIQNTDEICGYPCMPLRFLLKYKRQLVTAKEYADINLIEDYLKGGN